MNFFELLKHPLLNTCLILLIGSIYIQFQIRQWQNQERIRDFQRQFLNDLSSIISEIRLQRRLFRLKKSFDREDSLFIVTNIENSLYCLREESIIISNSKERLDIIQNKIQLSLDYFHTISQEIEKSPNAWNINNNKDSSMFLLTTYILPLTDEYKTNVLNPLNDLRIEIINMLKEKSLIV